jgi:DNA-directed RNA polymerase subunit beta'
MYEFGGRETLCVRTGDKVRVGDPINIGHFNLHELLEKKGTYAVQKYIVQEVQKIYASQGQTINDKHLEIIVKKMFSKVRIIDAGDSELLPGDTVDHSIVETENARIQRDKKGKGRLVTFECLLLGITRAALATDSWLAGASFQETIRVLVEAATTRKIDNLQDLKANVIIGRLIPTGEVYRNRYLSEMGEKGKNVEGGGGND